MNKLFIIGNLTRDPELRSTQSGKTVCNFTVAVNRRRSQNNGQPEADFFRVSAWSQLGENCQRYLMKGRKVAVVGPVSASTYQASDGSTRVQLEVTADDVEFLSSRNDEQAAGGYAAPAAPVTPTYPAPAMPNTDYTPVDPGDDLPF